MPSSSISLTLSLLLSIAANSQASSPNIVVVMTDDMGFSDLGCFGGEISTPNLDKLADRGLRLTRCYNAGMCVTSRTSLLTGRWWPEGQRKFERTDLLPEILHAAGYRTGLIGKWHLKGHPMDHGFDHFFGFLGGFADHFSGSPDYHLDRKPFKNFGPNYYSSSSFTDRAIRFVEQTPSEQPLFLFLAFQAPHNPLQAPTEDIKRHRGNYTEGWQALRDKRTNRQRELGIIGKNTPLPTPPLNLPDWDEITPAQRDLEDLRMATYAAMVEIIDRETGRLVDSLERTGRAKDTIFIFLSDNGSDSFSVADKAMLQRGKLPGEHASNYQPGTGWAYATVAPWRLYKISQHAGGVTTGAIIHWPKGIRNTGQIQDEALHFTDFLPTLSDAAGIKTSDSDGFSFLPLLQGDPWQRDQPMFFQFADNRAVRTSRHTLVAVDGGKWELYDSIADPLETKDISQSNQAEVARLSAMWEKWWNGQNNGKAYTPKSTANSPHYSPQGDRGSGKKYIPSAMPKNAPIRR
ncbi:MAG: sulfatase-like hydrolase/transferase [Akkermansiaceae bacterium]